MTDKDIQDTARLLSKLEPGFLPYPVFEQVARLVALPIIEFIPLRVSEAGRIQVLLIERRKDDRLFAGMLHTPGTVIRATDLHDPENKNWPAFHRIIKDELQDVFVSAPHYVGSMFHASKRGVEQAQLYWLEVLEEPVVGTFYDADALPEKTMDSQLDFIRQAVENFAGYKKIDI